MKRNKFLLLLAALLVLFFLGQLTADLSFVLAPGPQKERTRQSPSLGLSTLALSSRNFTDAAFAHLEADSVKTNQATVKQAMALLRRSLDRNPLDYQARYYLAKAYLRFSAVNNDYFDLGVRELKRAAAIRGSNRQIAIELGKVFLSLWPLLDTAEQKFTARLLRTAMPNISWNEFSPLVEMWSLYVQDTPLLMDLLRLKPDFFGLAANQLAKAGIPRVQRHEMLASYEVHTLDSLERRFNELTLSGTIAFKDAQAMLRQLRNLKGYHRLVPNSGFSSEKAAKLQRILLLQVIDGLMSDPKSQADPRTPLLLREHVNFYLSNYTGLNELDELQKLLEDKKYFKENDFSSLRLKTLIAYKKSDYNGVIAEIEALRKGISFVKKEQQADYTNILLLLVDSYYSTKLLTAAETIATELYKEQPDNPDVLWRVLRVQKILGDEGAADSELNEKLAVVEKSRFLTVTKANSSFDIFLFNQPWIEITFAPELLAKLQPGQIVQVFVNEKIAFESYIEELPEKIAIGPKFVEIESKVKVQVAIL
jgi:hypothetical protein